MTFRPPFPWFGGKARAASLVWERFGDVPNYIEPFAGGLAVLLARQHESRVETVNDKDAYLSNFWRAVQAAPAEVAHYADWPVNEADLHARHRWLVETAAERVERVKREPDYYDAQVAGWWVWGLCLWIGSGWCARPEWTGRTNAGRYARGINAGNVLRERELWQKRPYIAGTGNGQGVHAARLTWQQVPDLSGGSGYGRGMVSNGILLSSEGLYGYMQVLAARLRRVRVCCGDWRRVLTPSVTTLIGVTGVLLDPPYSHAERDVDIYNHDQDISADVRAWALAHGDDPQFRIALCGYEREHEMPDTWACVSWKVGGGYARAVRAKGNRHRERIWFSPHCLKVSRGLFEPITSSETINQPPQE